MFTQLRLYALTTALAMGSLCADSQPGPGGLEVSADFLYLMPTFDDTYFVINSPAGSTFPNGSRLNNDFDFKPGFRVGVAGGFGNGCTDFAITYTRLSGNQNRSVSGTNLSATIGRADVAGGFDNYAGTAGSQLHLIHHRVDALVGQKVINCYGVDLSVQFGLEYAFLRLNEANNYEVTGGATAAINQKSRTWGVGPELGFTLNYLLMQDTPACPGTLTFKALSSGSLLTGETETSQNNTLTGATLLDVTDQTTWRLMPAIHARIGFNYNTFLCDMETSLEIGYEFNSYLRGLSRTIYPDDVADGLSKNVYSNFDLQGLYISAGFNF